MRTPLEYEQFVGQALAELTATYEVAHRRTFTGIRSGREIVVDLSFAMETAAGARILVVVECKRYKNRVEVSDVEEFHSKLDDIGAHKGIMVTTVGYQDGAIQTARSRGIGLALLTDTPQPGEIVYLANSLGGPPPRYCSDCLLQGNFRPWNAVLGAELDSGLRFESFGQLWSVLHLSGFDVDAASPASRLVSRS